MLPKVALTDISAWDVAWPVAAGAGLGIGARLLRQGYDLKTKRGLRPAKTPTPVESAQIEVPVEVDEAEAAELKRQGIKVALVAETIVPLGKATNTNRLVSNRGVTTSPAPTPAAPAVTKTSAEGLGATLLQGGLLAGGAYGGWKLLDDNLDEKRLNKAKASLMRSRDRVKRLIAGQPEENEVGVAQAIKVAEELYLKKHASIMGSMASSAAGAITDIAAPLGIPLGLGAALLAAKSYNETKASNKYRQRVKQISETLEQEEPMPSVAVLRPTLRRKPKNSPADAGVIHNPGAEPEDSPELTGSPKLAAHHDDDDDNSNWIMLAIAGLAGAAGLYWVHEHPAEAKAMLPDFAKGWGDEAIDYVAKFGKPDPKAVSQVQETVPGAQDKAPETSTTPVSTPTPAAAPTSDAPGPVSSQADPVDPALQAEAPAAVPPSPPSHVPQGQEPDEAELARIEGMAATPPGPVAAPPAPKPLTNADYMRPDADANSMNTGMGGGLPTWKDSPVNPANRRGIAPPETDDDPLAPTAGRTGISPRMAPRPDGPVPRPRPGPPRKDVIVDESAPALPVAPPPAPVAAPMPPAAAPGKPWQGVRMNTGPNAGAFVARGDTNPHATVDAQMAAKRKATLDAQQDVFKAPALPPKPMPTAAPVAPNTLAIKPPPPTPRQPLPPHPPAVVTQTKPQGF